MNFRFFLSLIALVSVSTGCQETQSSENENQENDSTYIVSEETENTLILDEVSYADDWIVIRNAILDENEEILTHHVEFEGNVTAMEIIVVCREDWVKSQLANTDYSGLTEVDFGGELLKEFRAEDITENDGVEYGTGVIINLKETDGGLVITDLLTAR